MERHKDFLWVIQELKSNISQTKHFKLLELILCSTLKKKANKTFFLNHCRCYKFVEREKTKQTTITTKCISSFSSKWKRQLLELGWSAGVECLYGAQKVLGLILLLKKTKLLINKMDFIWCLPGE